MKKTIIFLLFAVLAQFSFGQSTTYINKYDIPYTVYGDTIFEDTTSFYVNLIFDQKVDLSIQAWGQAAFSGDTTAAVLDVALSEVMDASAFETDYSLTAFTVSNSVERKDTVCYSEWIKMTINTTDTALYNVVLKAMKPIE